MLFDGNEFKLPEDIAKMSDKELEDLCKRIRERLVEVVSKNGGHLASNLGVVELTVALYSIYDPFKDRIVWDVGHQSYVHKILTGRDAAMDNLRKMDCISGFPKREESKADAFDTGHSSTSVSAALGIARASKLLGKDVKTVAIIGDGALTGGMAFEALNDAAQTKCDITVILNDNGMSISKNVGALSNYLGKIRTKHSYINAKRRVKNFLSRIPVVGAPVAKLLRKIKNSIKFKVVPGEFFENLGLTYIGPVDGHDIKGIRAAIIRAEENEEPAMIHVITKKGKGYRFAEENPGKFHGIASFDAESGKVEGLDIPNPPVSMSKVFSEKLCDLASKDEKICAVTAAMPTGTGLKTFFDKYPDRFFDVGIAEQHAVTMCAGMSSMGAKPVTVIYSTFMQRAYDQILHDVSVQGLPLVVGLDRAGVAGPDGETHQGIYDYAFLGHLPNCTVAAPANRKELEEMLELGMTVYDDETVIPKGCFAIRYPAKDRFSGKYYDLDAVGTVEYGKGCVCYDSRSIAGEKAKLCIISIGEMLEYALEAAEKLAAEGVSVIVFNARFFKPLDVDGVMYCAANAEWIITVEDATEIGGFGEQVKLLAERLCSGGVHIAALPDEIIRHGKINELHKKYGLDAEGLVARYRYIAR